MSVHSSATWGARQQTATRNRGAASAHVDSARRMLVLPPGSGAVLAARCATTRGSIYEQLEGGSDLKVKTLLEALALEEPAVLVAITGHLLEPLGLSVTTHAPDGERLDPFSRFARCMAEVGDVARALPSGASKAAIQTEIEQAIAQLSALSAEVAQS